MTPEELFEQAIANLTEQRVIAWATSEHNKPILLKVAKGVLDKKSPDADPLRFSTWMVCVYLGL